MFVGGDGAYMPELDGDLYIFHLNDTDWSSVRSFDDAMWLAAMHLLGTPVSAARLATAMCDPAFYDAAVTYLSERIELPN